ncbi:hypothetical protein GGI35DRAFT_460699 [Trichoderma velutinum]
MDHLPNSTYQQRHVSIPYLNGPRYDNQGFDGFPQRQGYDIHSILQGDYSNHSIDEIEAFSQSWIFFALMSLVLDCSIIETDFVLEGNHGDQVLTARRYVSLRDMRRKREETWLFGKKQTWYNECHAAVKLATEYLFRLAANAHRDIAPMPLRPEVELSLTVMVSTLKFEVAHMFSSGIPIKPIIDEGGTVTNRMLMEKMRDDGWCQSHVEMLASTMDAAAMYYIGTLGPPKVKKNHSKCSMRSCEADQIVESEYVTKHRAEDCQCLHVGPNLDQVTAILSSGGFPYIKLNTEKRQDDTIAIEMETKPFQPNDCFVALSHVWSGGLGNPQTNTLPKCQLLWLYDKIQALPETLRGRNGTVSFWMDTLCVPLEPEAARRQAIRHMRSTYTEASAVLVLESELLLSTVHCTNEERLMRITCSSWMRRLWTYQEGILAQSLFFQFNEGAVSIEEMRDPLIKGSIYDRFSNGIASQGSRFYETLRWVKRYNAPARFLSLLDSLQWRQTSKLRDECICIAALFGLNMDQILNTPDELKFQKLLELQKVFIKDIPFLSGPKMAEEGYGWAPLAMMTRRGTDVLDMVMKSHSLEVHAHWTSDGLLGDWYGFELIRTGEELISETFQLSCLSNGKKYTVRRATEPNASDELEWAKVGPHTYRNAAIILRDSLDEIKGRWNSLAVLVEIQRKHRGTWYVRFKCRMVVKEYDDKDRVAYKWELGHADYPATIRDDGPERQYHGYPWCIM